MTDCRTNGEPVQDDLLSRLRRLYGAYVDEFRIGGVLPPMMELKLQHTWHVVENARIIASAERFDSVMAEVCEAAALLHDTGRYEQQRRYNTFRDADSVDHAVFSHSIVKEKGWLDGYQYAGSVLDAVLFHNRKDVPQGLDELTNAAAHCTRDSDKLDIFRVLEERLAKDDWREDMSAFWNLPISAKPNAEVLQAIRERVAVDYRHIRSLADFVLIQVGWIGSGLYYSASRRIAAERGHLEFRRRFLAEITDGDQETDDVCRLIAAIAE